MRHVKIMRTRRQQHAHRLFSAIVRRLLYARRWLVFLEGLPQGSWLPCIYTQKSRVYIVCRQSLNAVCGSLGRSSGCSCWSCCSYAFSQKKAKSECCLQSICKHTVKKTALPQPGLKRVCVRSSRWWLEGPGPPSAADHPGMNSERIHRWSNTLCQPLLSPPYSQDFSPIPQLTLFHSCSLLCVSLLSVFIDVPFFF